MNNSKVLVTGATGLTGNHTVRLLANAGKGARTKGKSVNTRSR